MERTDGSMRRDSDPASCETRLTGNLETPEDVPRSELSCETQRSAGYKDLPAGSTKTEINILNKCHQNK